MSAVRPRYLPIPYQDAADSGRLILRDGSTATVRLAQPADKEPIARFFKSLSADSRERRFFSAAEPPIKLIDFFCDNAEPRKALCLIVTRASARASRVIAAANYVAVDDDAAEIALAVDDTYQGKGIGPLLLERLAVLAARNGLSEVLGSDQDRQ